MGKLTAGLTLALVMLAAACSGGDSDDSAGTLLTTVVPASTTLPAATTTTTSLPATTTTVQATTTTSTTTTSTTTAPGTEVAGAGDGNTADTLVQLPVTGSEPGVTMAALVALLGGVWLLRWSRGRQFRLARVNRRVWRRPGAPPADPQATPLNAPNAVAPVTDADFEFQRAARSLALRHGVAFVQGVDSYATEWVQTSDLTNPRSSKRDDGLARFQRDLAAEIARLYYLP